MAPRSVQKAVAHIERGRSGRILLCQIVEKGIKKLRETGMLNGYYEWLEAPVDNYVPWENLEDTSFTRP